MPLLDVANASARLATTWRREGIMAEVTILATGLGTLSGLAHIIHGGNDTPEPPGGS